MERLLSAYPAVFYIFYKEFRVPIEERLSRQTKDNTVLHQSQGEPPIPVKERVKPTALL